MPAFSIVCHLHKQITTASSSLLLLHALSSCVANSNTVPVNEVLQDSSRSTPCFLGVGACSEQPCSKQQHLPSQRGAPGRRWQSPPCKSCSAQCHHIGYMHIGHLHSNAVSGASSKTSSIKCFISRACKFSTFFCSLVLMHGYQQQTRPPESPGGGCEYSLLNYKCFFIKRRGTQR